MAKQSNKTSNMTAPAASTTPSTEAVATVATVAAKAPKAPKESKAPKEPKAPKTEVAVEAPVSVAAAPAAATASKTPKAPRVPKVSKVIEAATVPAADAVVVDASAPVDAAVSVSSEFGDFMSKLQQLSTFISSLKTEFRALEKKATRELKLAAKAQHKRKRKTGNRSPSGFVKPTLISDELASFLGKTKGTEMARTEVTREINAYIRANQLQDKSNGRRINADTKLSSLLKLASGEELTYFNLQRYMSPHFAKSSATPAASIAHTTA